MKKQLGLNTKVKTETPSLHKFGVAPLFVFVENKPAEGDGSWPIDEPAFLLPHAFFLPGQCLFGVVVTV